MIRVLREGGDDEVTTGRYTGERRSDREREMGEREAGEGTCPGCGRVCNASPLANKSLTKVSSRWVPVAGTQLLLWQRNRNTASACWKDAYMWWSSSNASM